MLPDEEETGIELSSKTVRGTFLVPLRNNLLYDYEWGGVALNDVSQGLYYRRWRLFYKTDTNEILLKRSDQPEEIFILYETDVVRVGLAFDYNMNPQVLYVRNNTTYFRWFDTSQDQYVVTTIPDALNACVSLDDSRSVAAGKNDIILAYQKQGTTGLYYRMQRDRYQVEYQLADDVPENKALHQIGMTNKMRFQFMFKDI